MPGGDMSRRRADLEKTRETKAVTNGDGESASRLERLGEAVSRLRGGRRMDVDRMQLIVGAVLTVLGLMAIVVGWLGAANTGYEFEQTPYLISGGMLGLALCFLGGFVYFSYWVTRMVRDSRTQAERAAELLDQIAATLDGAALGNGRRPSARRPIAGAGTEFVATRGGTFFHLPDCSVVDGRKNLKKVTSRTAGLQPCRICDPLAEENPD